MLAKRIRSNGAIKFEIEHGHGTLAFVRHGSDFRNPKFKPTVVEKAFAQLLISVPSFCIVPERVVAVVEQATSTSPPCEKTHPEVG